MPCVQLSHNMLVNCIDNRQNQLFSEMSLRDVMELPWNKIRLPAAAGWYRSTTVDYTSPLPGSARLCDDTQSADS